MVKKDGRSLDARALEVFQKVNNSLTTKKGSLERERDARLMKAASALLEFKNIKNTIKWLLKLNKQCDNLPPIDLVHSEYATRELLKIIQQSRDGVIT